MAFWSCIRYSLSFGVVNSWASGVANSPLDSIAEDVSIGHSCYKEDSEITVKKVNYKYIQKDAIRGSVNSFVLFNDIYLYCLIIKRHKKQPKFRLDLTFFDPRPARSFFIPWKLLIAAVVLLLVGFFMPAGVEIPYSSSIGLGFLSVSVISILVGIGLLIFVYLKSYYRLVFRSYAGRVPLLSLSYKPAQKNYNQFVSAVQKGIALAHKKNGVTLADRLTGEMQDLRRLKDAGVIKEDIYNKAQMIILKNKHYR